MKVLCESSSNYNLPFRALQKYCRQLRLPEKTVPSFWREQDNEYLYDFHSNFLWNKHEENSKYSMERPENLMSDVSTLRPQKIP